MLSNPHSKIFFYDGDCGFCNATVQFLLDRAVTDELKFCALQSEYARKVFQDLNHPPPDITSAYLLLEGKLYRESTAVLKALQMTSQPTRLLAMFLVVPRPLRDAVYKGVASIRKLLPGLQPSCRILKEPERSRFIV